MSNQPIYTKDRAIREYNAELAYLVKQAKRNNEIRIQFVPLYKGNPDETICIKTAIKYICDTIKKIENLQTDDASEFNY